MRAKRIAVSMIFAGVVAVAIGAPRPADAACRIWTATHNGTDLFYPKQGGAAGTAANKLLWQVEQFKKEKRLKRVRVGKISTKCGEWFVKYLIPHKQCVAKARVCY